MFDLNRRVVNALLISAVLLLNACAVSGPKAEAESAAHRLHHLVIVWLKPAENQNQHQQYIQASRALANLPGVIRYDVGRPATIQRRRANAAVDESYDVAISAVFESPEAFQAFLRHPDYLQTAQQVLRPLVAKYKVYDFIE